MIIARRSAIRCAVMAAMLLLAGCDHGRRITTLEEKAGISEQEIIGLRTEIASLRSRADDVDGTVRRFALELNSFRQIVSGRSRLTATIRHNEWRAIYANGTGKSQMVRLTHRQAATTGNLEVRVVPIRRPVEGGSSPVDAILPPIVTPDGPPWDMSPVGAQRSLRLPCGYEIQSRGDGGPHVIDILVLEDPRPVSCDG
jgi:hypothetical protein